MDYVEYLKTVSIHCLWSMAAANAMVDMWKYGMCMAEIERREQDIG